MPSAVSNVDSPVEPPLILRRPRGLIPTQERQPDRHRVPTDGIRGIAAHAPRYAPCEFHQLVDALDRVRSEAGQRLNQLMSCEGRRNPRIRLATTWGEPADEILAYAKAHSVGLIVCGTRGRRGIDHLLMGSVAERVVRPCPVLTILAHTGQSATARFLRASSRYRFMPVRGIDSAEAECGHCARWRNDRIAAARIAF